MMVPTGNWVLPLGGGILRYSMSFASGCTVPGAASCVTSNDCQLRKFAKSLAKAMNTLLLFPASLLLSPPELAQAPASSATAVNQEDVLRRREGAVIREILVRIKAT